MISSEPEVELLLVFVFFFLDTELVPLDEPVVVESPLLSVTLDPEPELEVPDDALVE